MSYSDILSFLFCFGVAFWFVLFFMWCYNWCRSVCLDQDHYSGNIQIERDTYLTNNNNDQTNQLATNNPVQPLGQSPPTPIRQISATESILSFETALNNSVEVCQACCESVELRLPSYDDYINHMKSNALNFF